MRKEKGITLIALVITIIVLLILAGVTIVTLTGDNGLLTKAGDAKNATEIAEEKDIISISALQAQAEYEQGELEENRFSEALDANSKTGNKASIIASDIESFTVKFQSNRYYEVNKNGNINYIENATGEKTLTIQCINSKSDILQEYQYTIVTDSYSKLSPSIDKYEPADEKIEGEITENKTIQVMYYLICNDDTTLVFTGLDSNNNITTNEDEIVNYMVGDGIGQRGGCGLVSNPNCKAIVMIPSEYKNKSVTILGQRAFQSCSNIIEVRLADTIRTIQPYALGWMSLTEIVLPENLDTMTWAFFGSNKLNKVTFTGISGYANSKSSLNAFSGCSSFEEISISNNSEYKIINNILYSYDEKIVLKAPNATTGDIIIKNPTERIESWSFNQCSINSVLIGENVKYIGDRAFQDCSNLNTVVIDSSNIAKSITRYNNCGWILSNSSINNLYIRSDITEIGSYITNNYQITESDKEGYIKYVKK